MPAQELVVAVLDAVLPNLVAGLEVAVARLSQLSLADLADAAESVRRQCPVGIATDEDALHLDPGEPLLVLLQVVDEVSANVVAQDDRGAGGHLLPLGDLAENPPQRGVGQIAEAGQLSAPLRIIRRQSLQVDLKGKAGSVANQDVAVAVEDFAAWGARP